MPTKKRDWNLDAFQKEEPEPERIVPPPEVPAILVDGADQRVPKNAAKLHRDALARGIQSDVTYARGTFATRSTMKVVDSIAVRMYGWRGIAVGIWRDGSFKDGFVLCTHGIRPVSAGQLRGWVDAEE